MDETTVVIATLQDLPALLDMMEDFNRGEQIDFVRAQGEGALRALLEDRSLGVVGLLRSKEATLGYFVLTWGYDLEWNGRDSILTELYLVPEARGRGLGQVLMAQVEAIARENGAHALHLMVRNENMPARRLYERVGYTSPPRIFLTKAFR